MGSNKDKRDRVTKEIALAITPIVAAYLFILFYEAGFTSAFGIPFEFISVNITHVVLTNRLTLISAAIAFLWVGLYYNFLPSANSPIFKGIITLILILSLGLGAFFGKTQAYQKQEYLTTTKDNQEYVVVKIYKDQMVLAPFDRTTQIVYKKFTIQNLNRVSNLEFELENVGPLKPIKP